MAWRNGNHHGLLPSIAINGSIKINKKNGGDAKRNHQKFE